MQRVFSYFMGMNTSIHTLFQPEQLFCVTGWPLEQSLSPLLHNIGFQLLDLKGAYLKFAIAPDKLSSFVRSVRLLHIQGCSVTIPHKITILPLLDRISSVAKSVGSVNTLYWDGENLCGENTDVSGFLAPLLRLNLTQTNILLLGAGGVARAVLAGLKQIQCGQIFITTPSNRSHLSLSEEFQAIPIQWEDRHNVTVDLVINATPLGMHGTHENETPYLFDKGKVTANALAYDIVYNPLETLFLRQAKQYGLTCISGREMFFEQANAQFHLWTGHNLPEEAKLALDQALGV